LSIPKSLERLTKASYHQTSTQLSQMETRS